jgi:aspartate carbamoyltransferase catalytic subunit
LNRQADKKRCLLRGSTIINCFIKSSTRTRTSFELAGKRLGEALIDTTITLNAMHPDVLVVRPRIGRDVSGRILTRTDRRSAAPDA